MNYRKKNKEIVLKFSTGHLNQAGLYWRSASQKSKQSNKLAAASSVRWCEKVRVQQLLPVYIRPQSHLEHTYARRLQMCKWHFSTVQQQVCFLCDFPSTV